MVHFKPVVHLIVEGQVVYFKPMVHLIVEGQVVYFRPMVHLIVEGQVVHFGPVVYQKADVCLPRQGQLFSLYLFNIFQNIIVLMIHFNGSSA